MTAFAKAIYSRKGVPSFILQTLTLQLFFKESMSTMMRAAAFVPGGPEKLTIGETSIPELRENEILIKVKATAINRADTLQRKGLYPPPPGESEILGLEAAGTVSKLGPGASRWNIGDRVMALVPGGGNAEYVSVHEQHAMPVDRQMTWAQAGAIPEVWLTAYQLLVKVGNLSKEDTVLIHAGGSGVGTAAVQLVKMSGARSIVTAGSQQKIDTAIGLGAAMGVNYKEEDFADKVLAFTEGKGVSLILDCVGASYWEQNLKAIAMEGRWVLYGLMGMLQWKGAGCCTGSWVCCHNNGRALGVVRAHGRWECKW